MMISKWWSFYVYYLHLDNLKWPSLSCLVLVAETKQMEHANLLDEFSGYVILSNIQN